MARFAVEETLDDDLQVVMDLQTGAVVAELTHDDLGWSGMEFVAELIEKINRTL